MTDKPTGVFVRLHDGALNEEQIAKLCNPKRTTTESLFAIGTPVTGGELAVITTLGTLRNSVPCVRQSDALAKLSEKDAEIARLRSALDEIEMGIDALPDELECGDRMTAREMQRQALIIVKEEMKALKGP